MVPTTKLPSFFLEPVPVSSCVALCEVINLPMPGVFVCERYELMVIWVGWNVKVIRLLPEMSLIALRVNFPEHFSSPQTLGPRSHSAILTEWSSPVSFPFLWPFFTEVRLVVNGYCEDSAVRGGQTSILYLGSWPEGGKKRWLILI